MKLVILYQITLGSVLPRTCRFFPSCSNYAAEALQTKSFPKALLLIIWRIMRCNPLCKGGYDPVPTRKHDATDYNHIHYEA